MLILIEFLALHIYCGMLTPNLMLCRQSTTRAAVMLVEDPIIPALKDEPCRINAPCSADGLVCRVISCDD